MSSSPPKHHPTGCSEQLMLTPSLAHRCNGTQSRFHAPAALSDSGSENSRAGRGETHCVSAPDSQEGEEGCGELRGCGRWQSAPSAALYHPETTGGPASLQPRACHGGRCWPSPAPKEAGGSEAGVVQVGHQPQVFSLGFAEFRFGVHLLPLKRARAAHDLSEKRPHSENLTPKQ